MNRLGFVPKGLLGDLYWPGCSKQYHCIPTSRPYRKRPSAPSIPFLCIGRRGADPRDAGPGHQQAGMGL
ncbi:hypothetical protein BDW68DRAFT_168029 [Aspergillus falconensis]